MHGPRTQEKPVPAEWGLPRPRLLPQACPREARPRIPVRRTGHNRRPAARCQIVAAPRTPLLRKWALAQHRASHVDPLTPAPERGGLGRGSSRTSALVPSPPAARPASRAGRPGERKVRSVRRGAPSPNPLPRSGAYALPKSFLREEVGPFGARSTHA